MIRADQIATELAGLIAAEDFAADAVVSVVDYPEFEPEITDTAQIQVFAAGQAIEQFDRATHTFDATIQIGIYKRVNVDDNGKPATADLQALKTLAESTLIFIHRELANLTWTVPTEAINQPLFDLELLTRGEFLSVLTVTHRSEHDIE